MFILKSEVSQEKKIRAKFRRRIKILKDDLQLPTTAKPPQVVDSLYRHLRDKEGLKRAYDSICVELNRQKSRETTTTPEEKTFYIKWQRESKFRIYPQTWVGNVCLDAFTPAFAVRKPNIERGYTFKGLGFEVDGPIHDSEMKMKKDVYKTLSLNDLGLQLWRVTNHEVRSGKEPNVAAIKREFGVLCSRARARIWGRIHLITVLYHGDFGMVRFPQKLIKTVSKLEAMS